MTIKLPKFAYRISRRQYTNNAEDALSGAGGIYAYGRWHSKGKPILYCAENISLALLERVAHADEWLGEMSHDRVWYEIKLEDDNIEISSTYYTNDDLSSYDANWRNEGNTICKNLGDLWLDRKETCALIVPSAVMTYEYNILLNPEHPDFAKVRDLNQNISVNNLVNDDRIVTIFKSQHKL